MLGALERKLAAIVADGLAARPAVAVVVGGQAADPAAGGGVVRVGLAEVTAEGSFPPAETAIVGAPGGRASRRVLPLVFAARLELFRRPAGDAAADLAAARALLLDDLALLAHGLADPEVRTGRAFTTAGPDPGFAVRSFGLTQGVGLSPAPAPLLAAELACAGRAEVWPVVEAQPEGEIRFLDPLIEAQPLEFAVETPVVPAGGTALVRVRGLAGSRLVEGQAGERAPLRLAVTVASDLPPGRRGTIDGGEPGAEAGFRLLPVAAETVITYRAPADPGTTRVERVALHLATPDGRAGLALGSAPVRLRGGG